jgi:hypothetical protein
MRVLIFCVVFIMVFTGCGDDRENVTPEEFLQTQYHIIYSYYPMRLPWTRLGYTYDRGNMTTEIGLSENFLKKDSEIIVESVTMTNSYFGLN